VGARHVAWMRGAFNGQRLVVFGTDKPESKSGAVDATRANLGATGTDVAQQQASMTQRLANGEAGNEHT